MMAAALTCNLGTIASGAASIFPVNVQVTASAPTAGTLQVGPCGGS
ncbi:MAG: hypothetical protein HY899_15300 [Deltaproteobacteria bacterium]|nr:hypothetical protein [Deltaproteobacteria bacterium]